MPPRVVFYDGVCGLCHRAVRLLLRADRQNKFTFAPLQGDTALALRQSLPALPTDLSSMAYLEDGKLYLRSRAFGHIGRHLSGFWRVLSVLRFIPAPLADLLYRLIATVRYPIFGKYEQCALPSPEQRARFLP